MKWTLAQSNAINDRTGRSLLVSAGAGSGKTSVLTERLVRMITEGASLDDFLVVTFTNAAASDLKEKLYDKLSKAVAADPGNRHIYNQLFLLSGARISTIHSFCYELVKQNFNLLGISQNCRVMDDSECKALFADVMNDMFDELFASSDADISLLIDRLCPKANEAELASVLTEVYDRIRAFYGYRDWLFKNAEHYRSEAQRAKIDLFATDCGILLHDETVKTAKQLYPLSCELDEMFAESSPSYRKLPVALRAAINDIAEAGTYGAMLEAANRELPTAYTRNLDDADKDYYESTRKVLAGFIHSVSSLLDFGTLDFEKMFADCADICQALGRVILKLDKLFFAAKQKRGGVDFADLEQLTLKLLETDDAKPTELCVKLQKTFKQVFVDEYQDVNPLQDRIFSLLSRKDNRFTVGDTKQSIYRFRNAYPGIFIDYKNRYGDFESGVDNAVIFLRENFRCAKNIIDFTNLVTSYASKGSELEDEYKDEALIFSRGDDAPNEPVVIALADYKPRSQTDNDRSKAINCCADYIAGEIRRLAANGTPYRDIALLFSAIKGASVPFENALSRAGIPYRVMKSAGLLSAPEITLALSCLAAIDNPTDDVALFSMMRSPMFGFDADALYKIRKSNDAYSFITCVRRYAHGMHLNKKRLPHAVYTVANVCERTTRPELDAAKFLKRLDTYRTAVAGMQAHSFLWMFYQTSGLMAAASAEGPRQKANLLRLYQDAAAFEGRGFKGVSAFRAYIERLSEEGADIAGAQIADDDCVKLMTVHASKGLEYPVCFYVSADRKFNTKDASASLHIGHAGGISFSLNYPETLEKNDTPSRKVSSLKIKKENTAEELRKLYVALTRAKDKLYVVACRDMSRDYLSTAPIDADFTLDWILGALDGADAKYVKHIDISTAEAQYGTLAKKSAGYPADAVGDDALKHVTFKYYYSAATNTPAKVSVSQISDDGKSAESTSPRRVPAFIGANAGQKGTANHLFMQFCDMASAASKGAAAEAERLKQMRFITPEQYDMLDIKALDRFFKSDLYAEMSASDFIRRELRFSITDDGSAVGGAKGEEIMIQGVIDCFYKTERGLVIVDYKTDHVFGKNAQSTLTARHNAQIRYYAVAAERMTGIKVCRAVLYSFALGRAVEVALD